MTLTLIIEDRVHRPVGEPIPDFDGSIEALCSNADPNGMLNGVDPTDETMFNEYQLMLILRELDSIVPRTDSESRAINLLKSHATPAADKGWYLRFRGSPRPQPK